MRCRGRLCGVALTAMFCTTELHADTASEERADRLFVEARDLMDQGDNERACELLKQSYKLEKADGTLLNLAICEDARGNLATALEHYEIVLARATQQKRQDRIDLAQEQLKLLKSKVSRVTLRPSGPLRAAGVKVTLNGREVPETDWDVELPVDGGDHEVLAIARGKSVVRESFRIAPSDETYLVVLDEPPAGRKVRVTDAAWGLIGASAVLGAVSTGLGIGSLVLDESVDGCNYDKGRCDTEEQMIDAQATQNAALGLSWAAAIGLPLGAAGTLVGLLLPHEEVSLTVRPEAAFVLGGFVSGLAVDF